jgi:4-hydroxy-4-methyl-2-oxoglutarate aldolase
MEKHKYHGTIITEIPRPPKSVVEGFAKHEVCKVGDAMAGYGLMNYRIKSIDWEMHVAGPAVTVLTGPGDALYVQKVIEVVQPGDVVVIDAGGIEDVCCIGERLCYYMKLRGAVGVVVDGAVRDSKGIRDMKFPAFCKAVSPRIVGSNGPGAINIPIQCGGIPVNPGDIILGDDDGVVCVPLEKAEEVLRGADEHLANELQRLELIEEGGSITEVFGLAPKLKRWG